MFRGTLRGSNLRLEEESLNLRLEEELRSFVEPVQKTSSRPTNTSRQEEMPQVLPQLCQRYMYVQQHSSLAAGVVMGYTLGEGDPLR